MNREPMNDNQLNREIEEALAVEPSPQFVCRVRARVAETSRPTAAWMRWAAAGVGVAVAALTISTILLDPKETLPASSIKAVQTPPRPVEPAEATAMQQQPAAAQQVARRLPPEAPKTTEPEVLIDPRGKAAFQKFIEGVRKDRIDVSGLILDQQGQAQTIHEIALMPMDALMPLMIEPLASESRRSGRSEGGSL